MHRIATKLVRPSFFNSARNLTAPVFNQQKNIKILDKTKNDVAVMIKNPELETVIDEMYKHPIPRLSVSDSWSDIAMITDREGWLREQVLKGQAPIAALREMYRRQPPVEDWEHLIDEVAGVFQSNSPKP